VTEAGRVEASERGNDLVAAAQVLATRGLVTSFGHVSSRISSTTFRITPPRPLGLVTDVDELREVDIDASELPAGVPLEAWIHIAIYRTRPDVNAVCRAQPSAAGAMSASGVPIVPLHGQGAFLGSQVPVFDDAILVRGVSRAEDLARVLGDEQALLMRGNGAVTVGASLGQAVARMLVLESSAEMNIRAAAAGTPQPLTAEEQGEWRGVAAEILERLWAGERAAAQQLVNLSKEQS
jgi:HCOMODA/2-hydroxy-3-carboxy-muconic semialdehyde decarboxylase